jgi:signal transduction histidine kinase
MRVRTRLFVCLAAVTAVLLVPSLFAATKLTQLRQLAVEGRSGQASAVASLGRMQATMAELDRLERSFVATYDPQLGAAALTAADSLRADHARVRSSPYGGQAIPLESTIDRVTALATDIDQRIRRDETTRATEALGEMLAALDEADRQIATVADSIDEMARGDFLRAEQASETGRRQTLFALTIALLLTIIVTGVTARSLTGPLQTLGRAMARVADGSYDETEELARDRSDEIGDLMRSFETMARRLAELDRMKAEFLGMASHELKTPLNVINAYAELIGDGPAGEISERHRRLIDGLAEQASVMSRLIGRLMDLSRLEAGAYELMPEPVEIEDLLTGVKRMFEQLASEQGVDLRIETLPSAPRSAVVDVDVIRDDVLGNLFSNAFRYTPSGGWIELAVEGQDGVVVFTLTDSGPGIPEEHREFIFDKHYTADRTRGVGSGLGLAIVREMVALHGGAVTLEGSPPGAGACFQIVIPLAPASVEPEPPTPRFASTPLRPPRRARRTNGAPTPS